MVFELSRFNVMEHLWNTLEKSEDGEHIRYTIIDVEQLWVMGFVDTKRFGMDAWAGYFEPFRQNDGSFLIGRDDFLAIDAYRYKGEIRIPFDPMQINEGRYTDEGLDDLIHASIEPSCSLTQDELLQFFDTLKRDFRQPDGLILIRRPAKERINTLLDANPSPLRNLEILLDNMLKDKGGEMQDQIDAASTEAVTAEAARQASRFSSEPANVLEEKAHGLKSLEKSRGAAAAEAKGVKKVALKKIKRSRKGMRG